MMNTARGRELSTSDQSNTPSVVMAINNAKKLRKTCDISNGTLSHDFRKTITNYLDLKNELTFAHTRLCANT